MSACDMRHFVSALIILTGETMPQNIINIAVVEDEPQFQQMMETYIRRFTDETQFSVTLTLLD